MGDDSLFLTINTDCCFKGGSQFADETVLYRCGEKSRIYIYLSIFEYFYHVSQRFDDLDFGVIIALIDARGLDENTPK